VAGEDALDHAVGILGGQVDQRPAAFGDGLLGQQHTAHITVVDEAVGDLLRFLGAGQGAHGAAFAGVGQGALVSQLCGGHALDGGADAGAVHEGEHAFQTFVRRADQVAGGGVEVHHAGGRSLDAHLFFQRAAGHAVTRTEAAVRVGEELRYDEQRDAAGALGGVGQAGKDDVHDVLGEVVFATGDKNLGAGQRIAAVGVYVGPGLHLTQVGAALRLGQAHGTGPAAF